MKPRPLSELEPEESGIIIHVGGSGQIRRRLLDMGVVTGAEVTVARMAPLGDPIQIKVKGYDLALRKREAEKILVEVTAGSLAVAETGETVTVISVRTGWGLQRRLTDMGITPGVEIRVIRGGQSGQMLIGVRGSRLALGRGIANKILVKHGRDTPDAG